MFLVKAKKKIKKVPKKPPQAYEVEPGTTGVKPTVAFDENNPYRPKWIEAADKERVQLESFKTWRKLTPEEEQDYKNYKFSATPCALLLSRKRCGRYKGRLVVLGNRWKPDADADTSVYAPVVSAIGNRVALATMAKNGFFPIPLDIGNAFVRASIGDLKVCVTLPDVYREGPDDSGRRMLLKALYGLPVSPRLWAKTLAKDIEALGWVESKEEPGVWRKSDEEGNLIAILTIYVDDCLIAAKTKELAEELYEQINAKHPCTKVFQRPLEKGGVEFDLLGADVAYNQETRELNVSMKSYMDKLLKKHDMQDCKPRNHPSFPEANLYRESKLAPEFKYRNVIGGLQWAVAVCRVDLCHITNQLARASARPVTRSMAKAARLVLRYVKGTTDYGIHYSPQNEERFTQMLREATEHPDNKDLNAELVERPTQTFSDASFGVVYNTMKSITGAVSYLFSFPILWKSGPQTVFAGSTTESEWIAMSTAIELEQNSAAVIRFLYGNENNSGVIWCDNRAAVVSSRKSADPGQIPRRTRHVALRHQRVLECGDRVGFISTDKQLADGLTKSVNAAALKNTLNADFTPATAKSGKPDEAEDSGSEDELYDGDLASLVCVCV